MPMPDNQENKNKIAVFLANIPDFIYTISYSIALAGFIIIFIKTLRHITNFTAAPLLYIGEFILGIIATGFAGMILTMVLGLIYRLIRRLF